MLKKAHILLPVFISFWAHVPFGQVNNSDTLKKVTVRVTIIAKPKVFDSISNFEKVEKEGKGYKAISLYPEVKTRLKNQILDRKLSQSKNKTLDTNTIISLKKPQSNSVKETVAKPNEHRTSINKVPSKKNSYFLLSLLFIITGTLLVVFYRSGIPLIIAILLLVTGYYIFIYSLLFMV